MPAQVLVAIPAEWREELRRWLEQKGLSVIVASTYENALSIAQTHSLHGIISIAEWAIADHNLQRIGLVENGDGKTPAVMLVNPESFDRFFSWYNTYYSPVAEYCHVPVSLEQLLWCMQRVGIIQQDGS